MTESEKIRKVRERMSDKVAKINNLLPPPKEKKLTPEIKAKVLGHIHELEEDYKNRLQLKEMQKLASDLYREAKYDKNEKDTSDAKAMLEGIYQMQYYEKLETATDFTLLQELKD